ncbi:MAG: hypothetical protein ACKOYK_10570, partial [Cyanobium sp.]
MTSSASVLLLMGGVLLLGSPPAKAAQAIHEQPGDVGVGPLGPAITLEDLGGSPPPAPSAPAASVPDPPLVANAES